MAVEVHRWKLQRTVCTGVPYLYVLAYHIYRQLACDAAERRDRTEDVREEHWRVEILLWIPLFCS